MKSIVVRLMAVVFVFACVAQLHAKEEMKSTEYAGGNAGGKEEAAAVVAPAVAQKSSGWNLGNLFRYGRLGDGIKVDDTRWVIHPTYEQRGTFDSNIFMDPTNPKSDYFFDMIPGVEIEMPMSKHLLTAAYKADFSQYCKYQTQNSADQMANTKLFLDFDRYYVRQNNYFNDTTSRSGTEFTTKVQRRNWTFDTTAGAIWNKFTFETGYSYFFENYVKQAYQELDRDEHVFTSSAFYRIFPKTELLVESNTGIVRYDNSGGGFRDNNYYQVRGGVRGQILPKLTGIGKVGWMGKYYTTDNVPDYSSAVTYLGFVYEMTSRTSIIASYECTAREATYGDNNYYDQNLFTLELDQKIMNKLSGFFRTSYENDAYPRNTILVGTLQDQKRNDDVWGFATGLNYDIQEWLKTGVEYDFDNRGSNFSFYDYDRHTFFWKLAAKL